MNARVKAVYRQGAFVPETACDLPDESQVELLVQGPMVFPPAIADPQERRRLLRQIAEDMWQNPFPVGAPRFSREGLHERR